jgi:hypothetical protein
MNVAPAIPLAYSTTAFGCCRERPVALPMTAAGDRSGRAPRSPLLARLPGFRSAWRNLLRSHRSARAARALSGRAARNAREGSCGTTTPPFLRPRSRRRSHRDRLRTRPPGGRNGERRISADCEPLRLPEAQIRRQRKLCPSFRPDARIPQEPPHMKVTSSPAAPPADPHRRDARTDFLPYQGSQSLIACFKS